MYSCYDNCEGMDCEVAFFSYSTISTHHFIFVRAQGGVYIGSVDRSFSISAIWPFSGEERTWLSSFRPPYSGDNFFHGQTYGATIYNPGYLDGRQGYLNNLGQRPA